MIVNETPDGLEVLRQSDHARHAASLAPALPDVPPSQEAFREAVRVHDDGWDPEDDAPGLDPDTGGPFSYRSIPLDPYLQVWRRGIRAAVDRDPYVGLLVSLHGTPFFQDREGPEARAFVRRQRTRQAHLLDDLGFPPTPDDLPATVATHRALASFLDALSLAALDRWPTPRSLDAAGTPVEVHRRDRTLQLDPWPFDDPQLEAQVPARVLPDAPYPSREALHEALGTAPVRPVTVRVLPASR